MKKLFFAILSIFTMVSCSQKDQKIATIEQDVFGILSDSSQVERFTLKNTNGMVVQVITYGGIITSIQTPDKNGEMGEIVLGYDNIADYETKNPYFGALIGRYGNRIADGKFSLEGQEYTLAQNDGKNHLHGGLKGFDKVIWNANAEIINNEAILTLTYLSKDMEEGYPGNLESKVIYTLTNNNEIKVDYFAETDKTTIVNLTQHSYFNLSGNLESTILDHELKINADAYLPVDETFIPTGEIATVKDTPFDFTLAKEIGKDIQVENEQLKRGLGYDHCWVLNEQGNGLRNAATLSHSGSGRIMEVLTDEPGIQFYTGNFLDGSNAPYRTGLCLETQHYPNSPNQKEFPSVVLEPGKIYESHTIFKFSTK